MTAGEKEPLMNDEARDAHDAEVDNQDGPVEEVDPVTPDEDDTAGTLDASGGGRIVARVGPLGNGAYEKVR